MKRLLKLYGYFFKLNLKRLTIYRADFALNLIAMLVWAGSGVVEILILFSNMSTFAGWTLPEMCLLYGMWSLTFALYNAFGHGVMEIEGHIINGTMDTLLTKPLDPLYQLLTAHLNTMGLAMFMLGAVVTVVACVGLSIQWTLFKILFLLISIISGGLIIFSVNFMLETLAFWYGRIHAAVRVGYDVHMFAKYPISIYGKAVQLLLIFVFPFAFTNYVPAAVLLGKLRPAFGILPPLVALLVFSLALKVWKRGIQKYESAC